MKKQKVKKDRYAVIKKGGVVIYAHKANVEILIECPDAVEVGDKTFSQLTVAEKAKLR